MNPPLGAPVHPELRFRSSRIHHRKARNHFPKFFPCGAEFASLPLRALTWPQPPQYMPSTQTELARVEPATLAQLDDLVELVMELLRIEADFKPDRAKQEQGLRLILEQPSRGRIFVVRTDHKIIGMVNLLFTISTAEGGFVLLMEDVIIHPDHRGHGYGTTLLEHVLKFAQEKNFLRITLLTDEISAESQRFFKRFGFEFSHMIPMRLNLATRSASTS